MVTAFLGPASLCRKEAWCLSAPLRSVASCLERKMESPQLCSLEMGQAWQLASWALAIL